MMEDTLTPNTASGAGADTKHSSMNVCASAIPMGGNGRARARSGACKRKASGERDLP